MNMENPSVSTIQFGQTGARVSRVGLGGEGVLRTWGETERGAAIIREAISRDITYFDSAQAYAGSEDYYGAVWGTSPETRPDIFQASKSASRTRDAALADLDRTLERMRIDRLDLWQIHDVRTERDLAEIEGPGGALEAFIEAKAAGKVRFIGVTGHHDPAVLTRAVKDWPVDSVMMPVNPVEAALGGFLTRTLPAATAKGMAVIAMKVLGASHYVIPDAGLEALDLIRFALSQPITVAIVGCSLPTHVHVLAEAGKETNPMSLEDQSRLVELFRPIAKRLAFYRGVM